MANVKQVIKVSRTGVTWDSVEAAKAEMAVLADAVQVQNLLKHVEFGTMTYVETLENSGSELHIVREWEADAWAEYEAAVSSVLAENRKVFEDNGFKLEETVTTY